MDKVVGVFEFHLGEILLGPGLSKDFGLVHLGSVLSGSDLRVMLTPAIDT